MAIQVAGEERGKKKKCEALGAPSNCDECVELGAVSSKISSIFEKVQSMVETCNFELRCLNLGFKDNMCCSTTRPTTCQECMEIGDECIERHNQEKTCKKLGFKDGECPAECTAQVPRSCEQCEVKMVDSLAS